MDNKTPNQIKEYYIAYFDILGYKQFFETSPEKVPELLNFIFFAVQQANGIVGIANNSPLIHGLGKMEIKTKFFSDNILLCLEKTDGDLDLFRMITFFGIVAGIQRAFILDYGLFVRGGITSGELSFNDDFIFGKGIIDAVNLEMNAIYPRIVIKRELIEGIMGFQPTEESLSKAAAIATRKNNKETVAQEDEDFLNAFNRSYMLKLALINTVVQWNDKVWFLSYLSIIDPNIVFGPEITNAVKAVIEVESPSDFNLINQPSKTVDEMLKRHKEIVEYNLNRYGYNADIPDGDVKAAEEREKILRKYIWVMAYHNQFCDSNNKKSFFINTVCNCDKRFMKMVIFVAPEKPDTPKK